MEFYRDFYGGHAVMHVYKNGSVRLVVRTLHGKVVHTGNYKSRRGARIAMGRLSDGWVRYLPENEVWK